MCNRDTVIYYFCPTNYNIKIGPGDEAKVP